MKINYSSSDCNGMKLKIVEGLVFFSVLMKGNCG